jgi:hypothetical protein
VNLDLPNFVLSLAAALAGACSLQLAQDVFAHQADESAAHDPYAVFRCYGGPVPSGILRVPAVSVQCQATGKSPSAALRLANSLYEACYDASGNPRTHWVIDGKQIDGSGALIADTQNWEVRLINLNQPPGQIGRDDRGRTEAVFNFDIFYMPKEIS